MKFRDSLPPWLTQLLAKFHWTTWLVIALSIWALPRLLPHVGALVNVSARDRTAPTFAVRTLADSTITSQSLRGRVVLVNVWATWCIPCRVEMPLLEATWNRHKAAGLVLLGASVDKGDPRTVRDFVSTRGISYPIAIVGPDMIAELDGVRGYPTSVLIGRDGRVRHRVMGPIGPLSLEPAIRRALAEP
ncbi:TlpA family protein disulfide reductase [Gemmatimonas sp.]|uniref:TlpA family protein disulfide reductase n=1 Tax=Gemmatimonas sp. TaxID=1962908 RepID=UPI003565FABA